MEDLAEDFDIDFDLVEEPPKVEETKKTASQS